MALAKPAELNEDVAFVQLDVDVENNILGIIDLEPVQQAVVAGKATVGLRLKSDKSSVYDSLDDLLANAALWSVKKNGAAVTITTAAKNATTGGWDLSFTGAGEHVITLKDPTTLAAANVGGAPDPGFEASELTVTMPAP